MRRGDMETLRRGLRAIVEEAEGLQRPHVRDDGVAWTCIVVMLACALPAHRWMEARRDAHQAARVLLSGVTALEPSMPRRAPTVPQDAPPLIAVVNRSASEHGLALGDFRPDGEARLRVALRAGDFDAVLRWLARVEEQHGVRVVSLDVRPTDVPGRVDAMLTLEREGEVP